MRCPLILLVLLSASAQATTWGPPQTRVYTDDWGHQLLTIVPMLNLTEPYALTPRNVWVQLARVQADGSLKPLWKASVPAYPMTAAIRPWGKTCVALLDTYAGMNGNRHALVVIREDGKIVADYRFNDLVPAADRDRFSWLMSGYFLSKHYKIKWAEYHGVPHVALRDENGQGPTINCQTGKIKTTWNSQPRR